jgi:thiamine-monophosphate kinase
MKSKNKSSRIPIGEFDFLAQLERRARESSGLTLSRNSLIKGIGDDAAVIRQNAKTDLVVSADLLVEGIDFRLDWATPSQLGHKALAVSLSDIAAMGATPRYAMVSLGIPESLWNAGFADGFYDGWFGLADRLGVTLIGGDVSRTPSELVIDSITFGEAPSALAILRSSARPGDLIFVTGSLGGAAAGLRLLLGDPKLVPTDATRLALIARQLTPDPRTAWGMFLGRERLATAMIDLSDGLSSDLRHLCEASKVGAVIDAGSIPIDPALSAIETDQMTLLELAINGGEDFELLFTVTPEKARELPRELEGIPIAKIGQLCGTVSEIELELAGKRIPLEPGGFEHFSAGNRGQADL